MLYTTSIVVIVCHLVVQLSCVTVHGEYSVSCVMLYTTNIMVVVCHVVHDEYTGRVACFTRRI